MAVGDQKLVRHIGFFSGTLMNVGEIIGSGIFTTPALILRYTGSGAMMIMMWVLGAITSMVGLATFLEFGTMLPRSGAEKTYLAYIYPEPKQLVAFLYLILVAVLGRCGALAQASIVFGENIIFAMNKGEKVNEWGARGFGIFCISFWVVVNMLSAKYAMRFNNIFTILKIALLILLICVGFAGMAGRLPNQPDLRRNFSFEGTSSNIGSYASGIYYIIYSYGGYYNLQRVTDELIDPLRNLPRCGIASILFTTVVYLLANAAYLAVLSIDAITSSKLTVAASLFNTAFGGIFGSRVLPVLVGLSSFGFVGVSVYTTSRIILEYAREGMLPFDRYFSQVQPRLQTPLRSLLLIYGLTIVFMLAPPPGTAYEFILTFCEYGGYIFVSLCAIGLLILRFREPDVERPIKAPIPAVLLFIAICIYALVFVFIPPTGNQKPAYPYYVPYVCFIGFSILCTGLWYIKMVKYNALETSYNNEIRALGCSDVFADVHTKDTIETPQKADSVLEDPTKTG
ncbi:amino acid/polyamine transporter I [Gongronella butleri]|nr:amino acid/polyamine transporter I [Gongronella butleri]